MFEEYGINRVIGVKDALPVLAWKLDNAKKIYENEILLKVSVIHLEAANFKQVCNEAMNDPQRIKDELINMVSSRGKLHNPYTDTGGLIAGTVERIGRNYVNKKNVSVGDEVVVLTSTSMIPLHIDKIISIDFVFGHIHVEGHCILFHNSGIIKKPENLPLDLIMSAFEESSSLYHIYQLAKERKEFLIIGSNIITVMLYGNAIRKAVGSDGKIAALIYQTTDYSPNAGDRKIEKIIKTVFDHIYFMNLTNPLKCSELMIKNHPQLFDLSVNCGDVRGAETINVLTTKEKGTVFFSGLINNYNIALFLTEGIGKELNILCADGYADDYDAFMLEMLYEIEAKMEKISKLLYQKKSIAEKKYNIDTISLDSQQNHGNFYGYIYKSQIMDSLIKDVIKASKYDCPVLIHGETGVGKEKIAQLIHNMGNRNMQPIVKVNCAAIPMALVESEFFGYEQGAFTGSNMRGRKGYFEQAHKGILFLDEISEMAMDLQAKLLRVIQDKEFYRVGGERPVKVDVRVITATNKNLKDLIGKGLFREDLYYRLAVLPLHIAPLRSRKLDIIPIAEYFVEEYNKKYQMKKKIGEDAIQYLVEYNWPGNIRELENLIQRLLINSDNNIITGMNVVLEMWKEDITERNEEKFFSQKRDNLDQNFREFMANNEKYIIKRSLEEHKTTRKAADSLGITQAQLMRKKKKYFL